MNKEITLPYPNTKPFSSAIQTTNTLYISGQGSIDLQTGEIIGTDVQTQTIKTMNNIGEILSAANLTFQDLVKVNVYLTNRSDYQEFNETYRQFFQAPYPARTTIYCDLNYDLLVEIDAIAVGYPTE
ncbi:RidA family protein [Paenibacillus sp. LMG 31461]|uniref:RidA family protein n=1 Tax=Paenibacillus plantarum TaxID=2654975 RepID=A0ABX1XBG4_9BACL|nr:RidA family protein [Paenibacillus plantarum]NOU65401.1 RidA family protein [Paenibacillus plantarum]